MQVIIMSGASGSGKSTEARRIAQEIHAATLREVRIVSADHYFNNLDGIYRFDASKLPQAHGECLLKFVEACQNRREIAAVIVDNTNIDPIEMAAYVQLAAAYGCEVEIVTVYCDHKIAAARNVHGVPALTVERMSHNLRNRVMPRFWKVKQRTVQN